MRIFIVTCRAAKFVPASEVIYSEIQKEINESDGGGIIFHFGGLPKYLNLIKHDLSTW